MDDLTSRARFQDQPGSSDLASIVLSHGRSGRTRATQDPARVVARLGGSYDVRSVLVLAVVVALLAGVVGWATNVRRQDGVPPVAASGGAGAAVQVEQGGAQAALAGDARPVERATVDASGPELRPPGVDLRIGRIVAARTTAGGSVVRVSVSNVGAAPLRAEREANLIVMLDGSIVSDRPVGPVASGATAASVVPLAACPAGRHVVAAVVDPRGAVAERDEADNAASRTVSFPC